MPETAIAQQQEQGEVIGEERDVAHQRLAQAALQQIEQRGQDDAIGQIEDRRAELEKAVEAVEPDGESGHRLHEQAQMAQQDDQQGPVEGQGGQPEPAGLAVNQPRALLQARSVLRNRLRNSENFQRHPSHHPRGRVRAFEPRGIDPGQRFLLAAGRGDAERHRRQGPADDAPAEAADAAPPARHREARWRCGHPNSRRGQRDGAGGSQGHRRFHPPPSDGSYAHLRRSGVRARRRAAWPHCSAPER